MYGCRGPACRPRAAPSAPASTTTKILVAGGEGQDQRFLAAFKAVDLRSRAQPLGILPSMPRPRHGLAVGAIGNRLYTVSGDGQSAGNGIEHSAVPFNEILQVDLVLK